MSTATKSVPKRDLGSTGARVSMVGLGGFHLSKPSEAEAIRIVQEAVDAGIDFLDNSWDYDEGSSEERMGKALAQGGYRDRAFLMTKVDGRTMDAARRQLDESLTRLRTDHVDLWQFHEVIRFEDAELVFRKAASRPRSKRGMRARCGSSGSPGTRTRRSTCTCSTSPSATGSGSTPCRCRST